MRDLLWAMEPSCFSDWWQRSESAGGPQAGPTRSSGLMVPGRNGKSLAVVHLAGVLLKEQPLWGGTSTAAARQEVAQAASDPTVSGILLRIYSPGGSVAGIADLAADVRSAARRKPVYAQIEDMGASAAYWIASQADMVTANSPTALVGSIGTLLTVYDMSAMAERAGIKPLVFKTGPLKGAGVEGSVVDADHQSYFQNLVDETQGHFDAAVRSGRGLSAAELKTVRTGGVFPAARAQELRLIDGIRPLDKTLAALADAR